MRRQLTPGRHPAILHRRAQEETTWPAGGALPVPQTLQALVRGWSRSPRDVVDAPALKAFKTGLDGA